MIDRLINQSNPINNGTSGSLFVQRGNLHLQMKQYEGKIISNFFLQLYLSKFSDALNDSNRAIQFNQENIEAFSLQS